MLLLMLVLWAPSLQLCLSILMLVHLICYCEHFSYLRTVAKCRKHSPAARVPIDIYDSTILSFSYKHSSGNEHKDNKAGSNTISCCYILIRYEP